jgi:hypothetical protein
MTRRSLPLLAALAIAAPAGALLALAAPANAAAPKPVTIVWDGAKFTSAPTVASGTTIKWTNAGGPLDGSLTITYKAGPTKFTKPITIAKGKTSSGLVMTGASTKKNEIVDAAESGLGGTTTTGTIHVNAAPKPAPTPSTSATSSPKPTVGSTGKPKPSPTPSPSTGVLGLGATSNPPIGVGALPSLSPSPSGPQPDLAGPTIGELGPTPSATPTTGATVTSLAQPVKARRLGLPGALAAVLLAGVGVGVVRLARAEYGGNGGQPPAAPSST